MSLWRAFLRLLRAIWSRLCGIHGITHADQTEQQRLLGRDARDSSAPLGPTTIIVMRHGHRQDEEDAHWHQTAARPWDPPLSAKGKKQAAEAASQLQGYAVDVVISSPFRRCLQTSAGVVRGLPGLAQGGWLVDWQFAEVCEPRVLFGVRSDAQKAATSSDVPAWMWGGADTEAALDKFVREESRQHSLPVRPAARRHPSRPVYPEELEQGLARYSGALTELAGSFAGRTVLVVTHGECVRQAVQKAAPASEVFEVNHTGYVVLRHSAAPPTGGGGGPARPRGGHWQLLSQPGESGVLWLRDEEEDE